MVETCANPACAAPFRYWRGGKLFRCDVKTPSEPCLDIPDQICRLKPVRSSVFFWLCENCCSTMTLRFDPHKGLAIVPLGDAELHHNAIGATEAQALGA
jgi:hypothetical protein